MAWGAKFSGASHAHARGSWPSRAGFCRAEAPPPLADATELASSAPDVIDGYLLSELVDLPEEAQRAELERLAEEERKAVVAAFLKEHGFTSVTAPRKKLLKNSYALHKAAKLGDAQLCEMLLQQGADPAQKDSRGKTPGQVALAENSKNSHAMVVQLLGGETRPTMGGA